MSESKIPVGLYVVSGVLAFPFWTGIVLVTYFQQKKHIREGDYHKADRSISMAKFCCWFMTLLFGAGWLYLINVYSRFF